MKSMSEAKELQKKVINRLKRLEGFRGVGITWSRNGDLYLKILVDTDSKLTKRKVSAKVGRSDFIIERISNVHLESG